METEEELILGMFKKGDVVVSLENSGNARSKGDLFKVLTNSSRSMLYYKEHTNSMLPKGWRIATEEEKQAYEKGVKNIKDIVKSNEFLKGEYIVTLGDVRSGHPYPKNFIFKQRVTDTYLRSELDSKGSSNNGITYYSKLDSPGEWRYATKEEEKEYERRNTPYDVTELNSYNVEIPKKDVQFVVGKWYQFDCYNHTYIGKFSGKGSNISSVDWIVGGSRQTSKGVWPKSRVSNIRMLDASISQIQSYLPEDHPDKIHPEFGCIPGEIYRVDWTRTGGGLTTIIFKPLTNEGHKGQVYYLNISNTLFGKNNGVCTAPDINIKLSNVSLEEKQWLDTCIQHNKFIPKAEISMKEKQKTLIKGEIYKCKETEGSIFMFDHGNSASHYIGDNLTSYGKGGGNFYDDPEDYELANAEERTWLLACIKADRFIEKEKALNTEVEKRYEYQAVYTKTEKEWDFVLNYYQSTMNRSRFRVYKNICYVFKNYNKKLDSLGSLEFMERNNSKIYSFDEWKKEMGIGSLNITTSGTFTVEDGSVCTSKYTVKMDEFGQIGCTYPPSIEWVEYKYSDKSVYTKKQGVEHQEPIIKKKINKQKSILVL